METISHSDYKTDILEFTGEGVFLQVIDSIFFPNVGDHIEIDDVTYLVTKVTLNPKKLKTTAQLTREQ